jgi:hypothetical protein
LAHKDLSKLLDLPQFSALKAVKIFVQGEGTNTCQEIRNGEIVHETLRLHIAFIKAIRSATRDPKFFINTMGPNHRGKRKRSCFSDKKIGSLFGKCMF